MQPWQGSFLAFLSLAERAPPMPRAGGQSPQSSGKAPPRLARDAHPPRAAPHWPRAIGTHSICKRNGAPRAGSPGVCSSSLPILLLQGPRASPRAAAPAAASGRGRRPRPGPWRSLPDAAPAARRRPPPRRPCARPEEGGRLRLSAPPRGWWMSGVAGTRARANKAAGGRRAGRGSGVRASRGPQRVGGAGVPRPPPSAAATGETPMNREASGMMGASGGGGRQGGGARSRGERRGRAGKFQVVGGVG